MGKTAFALNVGEHIALQPIGTSSVLEVTATAERSEDAVALAAAEMSALGHFVRTARTGASPVDGDPNGIRLVVASPARSDPSWSGAGTSSGERVVRGSSSVGGCARRACSLRRG